MPYRFMTFVVMSLALLLPACRPRPLTTRPPTAQELMVFAGRESVDIIAQELVGQAMVVLFQNEGTGGALQYGYYKVTVDESLGRLVVQELAVGQKRDGPVLVFGDGPFAGVVIQDEQLLENSAVVAVTFTGDYRVTKPVQDSKGLVLVSPVPEQAWERVVIYDASGDVLYEQSR